MPSLNELPIQPAAGPSGGSLSEAQPTAVAEPAAPAQAGGTNPFNLPPEVANIPAVQMIAVGSPPAVRVAPGEYYPEIDPLVDNLDKVIESGLDVYRTQKDSLVMFNPLFISGDELAHLDQTGQLESVVPDYGSVSGSMPKELTDEEVAKYVDRSDALQGKLQGLRDTAPEPVQQPVGTPTPVPAPSPSQLNAVAQEQNQALQAFGGPPTSGARPGGGRLLNALMKPPVR